MTKQATPISPPLIIDEIERFAAPGLVASMDAMALGAFVRLLSHAWQQEPPCSLPADDGYLAVVARTSQSEWERVRPVILLAFSPTPAHQLPDPQGNRNRLVNAVARGIFDQVAAERQSVSEAQRARAFARWRKPPDAGGMPAASAGIPVASNGISAPSLRSESSSLSLPRSIPTDESPRSSERSESERDVIAQLGDRARAIGDDRIAEWKRRQSLDLLQNAIVDWRNRGLTDYPISSASRLASGPWSEPARVEAVLEDIAAQIAGKRMRNPVGYLLCGLGLAATAKRGIRPAEIPLQAAQKWAAAEASQRKTFETVNAIQAAANRIRAQQQSTTAQAGGA